MDGTSIENNYYALHIAVDGQPSFRMAELIRQNRKPVSEGILKYVSSNARTLSLKANTETMMVASDCIHRHTSVVLLYN